MYLSALFIFVIQIPRLRQSDTTKPCSCAIKNKYFSDDYNVINERLVHLPIYYTSSRKC
jgi:hypothetical protein